MLACTAACGRIGFDSANDAGTQPTDGTTIDLHANAMTTTFGEHPSADVQGVTTDTFISNEAGEPTLNYGGADELRSEQDVSERILLRFDLGAIAPTPTVVLATLTLEILQTHPTATWELHPVLQSWNEGTSDGGAGAANFTQRIVGQSWDSPGCGEPSSAGPTFTTVANIPTGAFTFELDPATVQLWISTPSQNFGMVVYNTFGESVRFASSEHATQALRPVLSVTYVP